MKLALGVLVLLFALAAAWLGAGGSRAAHGLAAPESVEQQPQLELAVVPAAANPRVPDAGAALLPGPGPTDVLPAERATCVEALTLAGLVLDEGAQDADFERAFSALPRDERVLARHRIRKLFAAGQEDPQSIRALVPDAAEIGLLARELHWLSANLDAEPADPLAVLRVARLNGSADPGSFARQYAGACDEELAREYDALQRALALESERGLDERIAAGQYRVRQQSGEY